METTKLAYLAGILDGEGHFSIVLHKQQNRHHLLIGVMNTSESLMTWLKEEVGGTVYHRQSPSNKNHWKPRYEWRIYQAAVDDLLPLVIPFLVIKREHAKIALDFRATFKTGRPRRFPVLQDTLSIRDNLRSRLLTLNS